MTAAVFPRAGSICHPCCAIMSFLYSVNGLTTTAKGLVALGNMGPALPLAGNISVFTLLKQQELLFSHCLCTLCVDISPCNRRVYGAAHWNHLDLNHLHPPFPPYLPTCFFHWHLTVFHSDLKRCEPYFVGVLGLPLSLACLVFVEHHVLWPWRVQAMQGRGPCLNSWPRKVHWMSCCRSGWNGGAVAT